MLYITALGYRRLFPEILSRTALICLFCFVFFFPKRYAYFKHELNQEHSGFYVMQEAD